jgi:hypothetical protein
MATTDQPDFDAMAIEANGGNVYPPMGSVVARHAYVAGMEAAAKIAEGREAQFARFGGQHFAMIVATDIRAAASQVGK